MDHKASPTPDSDHHPSEQRRVRCRRRRHFVAAAALLSLLLGWNYFFLQVTNIPFSKYIFQSPPSFSSLSSDIIIDYCSDWTLERQTSLKPNEAFPRSPYRASTEFELPLSSDTLFLLSQGQVSGELRILQGGQEGDVAKVQIVARYRDLDDLQDVQVCAINRGEGENGVGIFGPEWRPHRPFAVGFQVSLYLPQAPEGSPLHVKNLETDMPLFSHRIGDLNPGVYFDSVSLKAENMPIEVKSLYAADVKAATVNNVISGHFRVSTSLSLLTSNSPINVALDVDNDQGADNATDIKLHTSNGPIKAKLKLASDKETGSAFSFDASTQNSPLELTFLSAPVDSALALNAYTSIGSARIKLHETYQGTFRLRTSLSRPKVSSSGEAKDPAGKGRKRKTDVRTAGPLVSGSVLWSDEGLELGSVDVETSLAPVVLIL